MVPRSDEFPELPQAEADIIGDQVSEQRLRQRELGLLAELLEFELVRDNELRLLDLEHLPPELPLDPQFDEPLLLVEPQVTAGIQKIDEVHPASQRAAGDVEEAVGRLQALLDEEVELESTDLLPESSHVFAMTHQPDSFLALGLQIGLVGTGVLRWSPDQALQL